MRQEVFTPKCQYRAQHARYQRGADETCVDGVDKVWRVVDAKDEVVAPRVGENKRGVGILPQIAKS
jgi:hypothetical protein